MWDKPNPLFWGGMGRGSRVCLPGAPVWVWQWVPSTRAYFSEMVWSEPNRILPTTGIWGLQFELRNTDSPAFRTLNYNHQPDIHVPSTACLLVIGIHCLPRTALILRKFFLRKSQSLAIGPSSTNSGHSEQMRSLQNPETFEGSFVPQARKSPLFLQPLLSWVCLKPSSALAALSECTHFFVLLKHHPVQNATATPGLS